MLRRSFLTGITSVTLGLYTHGFARTREVAFGGAQVDTSGEWNPRAERVPVADRAIALDLPAGGERCVAHSRGAVTYVTEWLGRACHR